MSKMSKRLNKRQQREQEELAELNRARVEAAQGADEEVSDEEPVEDEAEEEEVKGQTKPFNPFAAVSTVWISKNSLPGRTNCFALQLNEGDDQDEDEDDEPEEEEVPQPKQSDQPSVSKVERFAFNSHPSPSRLILARYHLSGSHPKRKRRRSPSPLT
jgi:hypothetical protein